MNKYVFAIFILIVLFILFWSYLYYQSYDLPNVELKTHLFEIEKTRENIYNPSFVDRKGKIICSARLGKKRKFIGSYNLYTELDENLQTSGSWKIMDIPIPEKYNEKGKTYQYEDVRLFYIQNRLFSLQSFLKMSLPSIQNLEFDPRFHMSICEWDDHMNLISLKHYDNIGKGNQKNWVLFENQNKIYMVTDFSPFRYYEVDPITFELSNPIQFEHEFKDYRGCKIFFIQNNKLKCMAHQRNTFNIYYNFKIFNVDLNNKKVEAVSKDMSLTKFYGIGLQYPHMVQSLKDKYYLSVGIEDSQSMILEWKEPL